MPSSQSSGAVQVSAVDKRTITCNFPASAAEIANAMGDLDGYVLTDSQTMTGGDQRDPYAIGVRLIFTRGDNRG